MTRSALAVRCPFCKAPAGSACRVGRSTSGKGSFNHPARRDAALALVAPRPAEERA